MVTTNQRESSTKQVQSIERSLPSNNYFVRDSYESQDFTTSNEIQLQTEMESIQVIEGYLGRQEDCGLFRKWKKSFHRLCGSKLFYSDENMIVIDYIDLLRVKEVHGESSKSFIFYIEDFTGHKFALRADSDALKLYWIVKIKSLAKYLQHNRDVPTSNSC